MIRFRAITGLIVMSLAFVGLAGCDLLKNEEPVEKEPAVFRVGILRNDFSLHPYSTWASHLNNSVYSEMVESEIIVGKSTYFDASEEWSKMFDDVTFIDNNTVIVTLRDDVYFHNGEKMTSDDVAFSFKYGCDSQFATRLYPRAYVEIFEDGRMKLTKESTLGWSYALAGGVLNRKYELAHPNPTAGGYSPMGTGPYEFVSFDEKQGVVRLKRYEKYFEKTKSFFDEVEIHLYENSKAMAVAFLEGRIDISSSLTADDVSILAKKPNFVIEYLTLPCPYQYYPLFRGPGESREIRKAFSMLVDRESLIRSRAIAPFAHAATDFPFRIKQPFWPEGYQEVGTDEKMFNRDEAYRLLAQNGWHLVGNRLLNKEGKPLRLRAYISRDTDEAHQVAFRQVISQWADAGILLEDSYLYDNRNNTYPPAPGGDIMEVLFVKVCLQETLGMAKDTLCSEELTSRNYCEIDEVASMLEKIRNEPENYVLLQPLYAKMLREQALFSYLYYPRSPFALNARIPKVAREHLMMQPYSLTFLFRGSVENRVAQ